MAEEKNIEDVEKEKKELDNKKRLSQQSLLLMNLQELSKLNRDKFTKGEKRYKNFLLLDDEEPWSVMTKLNRVNMLPSSELRTDHFSALVPEIRIFVEETVEKKNTKTINEIVFPTHAGVDQKKRYNQSIYSSIASTIAPNIGLKSIDWSSQGTSAFMQGGSFIMSMTLFAERLSDFFATVPGTKVQYSDLFSVRSSRGFKKRLKMQIGWSIDKEYEKVFDRLEKRDKNKQKRIKRALRQMSLQKQLLDVTLTNFDFDFTEEGAVTMNITFKAYLDNKMNDPKSSNILFDLKAKEKENTLLQDIQELEKKIIQITESDPDGMSMIPEEGDLPESQQMSSMSEEDSTDTQRRENNAHIRNLEKKIIEKQKKLADVYDNIGSKYASFVEELIKRDRVRVYSVSEENLLYRFKMRSGTNETVEDLNTVCSRPKSKVYPDLFFVKDIPLAGGDGDTSVKKGSLKMYVDKSGNRKYAYFKDGASQPSIVPPFNNDLMTEQEVQTLAQQSGHNFTDEDQILSYIDTSINNAGGNLEKCSSKSISKDVKNAMSKKVNEAVKSAVDTAKSNQSQAAKDLAKTFDEVSKPEYSDGNYNIKYFFLGDLIEIALDKLKAIKGSEISSQTRFIVGPVELNNYGSDSEIFQIQDLSIKNGVLEATRAEGTKTKSLKKEKPQTFIRNIADIPISLNCFLHYFNQNYVTKRMKHMNFGDFLVDMMRLAIRSTKFIGDGVSLLPKQDVKVEKAIMPMPVDSKEKNERDYFGFDKNGQPPKENRVQLSKILNPTTSDKSDSFEQVYGAGGLSFREAKLGVKNNPGERETINYVFIYNTQKSVTPEKEMDFVKDSKLGIPHFFIGGKQGLMKSISFSLVQNKYMQSDLMLKQLDTSDPPSFPIAGRYEATITLFGNTFFAPGSVVCINPSGMRLGSLKNKNSPVNKLGIVGYYTVKRVSNYIQNGQYETKLECNWVGAGNGYTRDGVHHTKTGIKREK